MKPLGACVLCLVATLVATPAVSQTLDADTLAQFIEHANARDPRSDSTDWDDLLSAAAKLGGPPDRLIAAFASRIGVSPDAARAYASVIVESVVPDDTCDEARPRPERCAFSPGQPRFERAASLARLDRSGNLLIALAKGSRNTRQDEAALVTLARTHPAATTILRRLFETKHESVYLLAMAASGRLTERTAMLAGTNDMSDFRWSNQDDAWRQALIESVERAQVARGASVTTRAALARIGLLWKLELGLIDEAVASYFAYPSAIRKQLPLPLSACRAMAEACGEGDRYRLTDELAAALWHTGHTDDANRLMQREIADLGPRQHGTQPRYLALSEAMWPAHSAEELFPLFVEGRLPNQPPPNPSDRLFSLDGEGWLFAVRSAGQAVRRVVAGRLRATGYEGMSSYLEQAGQDLGSGMGDPVLAAITPMFPRSVSRRQAYWQTRIDAAAIRDRQKTQTEAPRVSTRALPPWWVERTLPDSIAAWRETDVPQTPPEGATFPVDRDAIVRYEELNGERAIVFLSAEYDLPGETPAAGVWFVRTVGGAWGRPLYLGLQLHFPYLVTPGSRLALLRDGRLHLEVQVREIDSATITFPPVSLGLKRSADGVYLDFDLATLASDRDGDGLTDIEERRIGLDFAHADTDGDGISDGIDPLPLVAYRPQRNDDGLPRAIVSQVFGSGLQPIVVGVAPTLEQVMTGDRTGLAAHALARTRFLIGDPAMYAGVATPFRLIIYSPADVVALDRGAAPFYPARVTHIFSSLDGTRHHVAWSASWTGGTFMVTCDTPAGTCRVRSLGSWIT